MKYYILLFFLLLSTSCQIESWRWHMDDRDYNYTYFLSLNDNNRYNISTSKNITISEGTWKHTKFDKVYLLQDDDDNVLEIVLIPHGKRNQFRITDIRTNGSNENQILKIIPNKNESP